jgi:ribosomal protein S18 acetylase RimI-like enzyme
MPDLLIRPYENKDLEQLYNICLTTGKDGEDAKGTVDDEILGHIYAAPYAAFEPDLCFVLDKGGIAIGYVLGTRDSTAFAIACEQKWWPELRLKYPLHETDAGGPTALLTQRIHQGYRVPTIATEYPAHLHIDLLPIAQGQGFGRKLIEEFINRLRDYSVPALHFGVSRINVNAIGFYKNLGFQIIEEFKTSYTFGLKLD